MNDEFQIIEPVPEEIPDSVPEEKSEQSSVLTAELQKKRTPDGRLHILSIVIFSTYLFLLVWLISLKCNMKITITDTYYIFGKMNWQEKLNFAKNSCLSLFKASTWVSTIESPRQDLLNVVAFLPFGIYLGYFLKRSKLLKTVAFSFLLSFTFEAMQLVTHIGCFTGMDLLTNTLGGVLGYFIYKLIYKDSPKRIKLLTVASYIVLIAAAAMASYALIKTATMLDFYFAILSRRY